MAGRYTGSYLDRSNGWRAVATLADIGRASLVGRIPKRETLNAIVVAEVVCILALLMLLVAGSRLTDFDYLAERYQSLISGGPNAVRRTLQTLGR
jgi:hypothetical protein